MGVIRRDMWQDGGLRLPLMYSLKATKREVRAPA
jgi:hypothetical protein